MPRPRRASDKEVNPNWSTPDDPLPEPAPHLPRLAFPLFDPETGEPNITGTYFEIGQLARDMADVWAAGFTVTATLQWTPAVMANVGGAVRESPRRFLRGVLAALPGAALGAPSAAAYDPNPERPRTFFDVHLTTVEAWTLSGPAGPVTITPGAPLDRAPARRLIALPATGPRALYRWIG